MTVEHSSKTQKKVKCSYVAHFGTPNLLFLKQSFFFFAYVLIGEITTAIQET